MSNRPTSMKAGTTAYWTLMTYDADGILVDADITPSVAVRKNGASVADSVTVTKRSSTTGIYDAYYNPSGEAGGDCFTLEETVYISQQVYLNPWSLDVAIETDVSNLATQSDTDDIASTQSVMLTQISGQILPNQAAIIADTSELQQNQGDWATATGFSTFDPSVDVVARVTLVDTTTDLTNGGSGGGGGDATAANQTTILANIAALNDFNPSTDTVSNVNTVQTTVSNTDMRGTDGANTVAPVDVSTDVAAILADTNELQTNQGQWLTATGFSTFDHTTDEVITDAASRNASKADVSGLSTFDATTDQVVASNMRGTDGANTVAPVDVSANVALILADTNELQQNQGQWLTATGFNTVAPDNASIAYILADTNELQQNQGDWVTATGFSTFDHTTDTVITDAASRAASKADVSGLSTFDPSTDQVITDAASRAASKADVSGLSTFDASTDQVVASNMRGTDDALLASSAPTNWSDLAIEAGTGKVTTANPAAGSGSSHTAQDVADLILVTPANKLATDASGDVAANNMRGTDGANTVTPNTVAPDNASIAAILADTNELQQNQGDWLTATGFNTVAPDNASITAILADTADLQANQGNWLTATGFSTFDASTDTVTTDTASRNASKADVSGLSTFDHTSDQVVVSNMRGTDGANTVTPATVSDLSGLSTFDASTDQVVASNMRGTDGANTVTPNTVAPDNASIAAILADTDELQSNQDDWLTADVSGLSTQSSVDALQVTADAILNDTEDLQTHQGDWVTADVSGLATQSSVDVIDGNVDEIKSAITTSVIPNQVTTSGFVLAVKDVTDKLDTMLQVDGSNFQYTVDALALAPTGSGGGGTGASSAEIYNYFTSNGREVVFQADVSGLSTFDSATDQVTAGNMVAEAPTESDIYSYFTSGTRENEFKADVSGLSTLDSADINTQAIAALNAYDAAKGSEVTSSKNEIVADIAGLNNFDPASDTVANVTTVQTVISGGGGGGDATAANQNAIIAAISGLNDFDPSTDVVANVTTVQNVINGGGGSPVAGGAVTVKATPTPRAF